MECSTDEKPLSPMMGLDLHKATRSRDPRPLVLQRVRVPGDGTCFFHAVSLQVKVDPVVLRRLCSSEVHRRALELFEGLPLKDWIAFEYDGMTVDQYADQIRQRLWGGPIEMKLLADQFRRPFVVYQFAGKGPKAKQLLAVMPSTKDNELPVYLLYCGNHFDALMPLATIN